ncbi:hypothetical protein SRIMM317S_07193 [Streptomyces rimosus subsp. rimosus]
MGLPQRSVAFEPGFRVAVIGGSDVVAQGLMLCEGGTRLAGEDREEALGFGRLTGRRPVVPLCPLHRPQHQAPAQALTLPVVRADPPVDGGLCRSGAGNRFGGYRCSWIHRTRMLAAPVPMP